MVFAVILDTEHAVNHVHAACEGVIAGGERWQMHVGVRIAGQHGVKTEVGEHDV